MKLILLAASAALTLAASAANATTFTPDFSTPVVTSPTEAPGVWYTDRKDPAVFQSQVTYGGRGNTLYEATSPADAQTPANSFYNTQGRAYDVPLGTTGSSLDLYNDPLYANFGTGVGVERIAGFWGVGLDNTDEISAFPIEELDKIDGVLTLRGWDSNGSGSWITLASGSGIGAGWNTLSFGLDGSNIDYGLNGVTVGTVNSGGTVGMKSIILQTYNTSGGVTDFAHWSAAGGVPEPATWAMMMVGFGGIGAALRRRRQHASPALAYL